MIQFLHNEVLGPRLAIGDDIVRDKRPHRVPEVLARVEVAAILTAMQEVARLIATILYGTGLRVGECVALRVKDVDTAERVVTVRGGKGGKDRMTVLPETVISALAVQIGRVRTVHAPVLAHGCGAAPLPHALAR